MFRSEKLEELYEIFKNIEKDYILVREKILKKTHIDIVKIFEMYGDIPLKDVLINYFNEKEYICFEKTILGFYTKVCILKRNDIKDKNNEYLITGVLYNNILYFKISITGFNEMMNIWLNLETDYMSFYLTQEKYPTLIKKDEYEVYKMLMQQEDVMDI